MALIDDAARSWAAREHPVFEFEVGRNDIARYARAIGSEDARHYDRAAAREAGYADVLAPTTFPYAIRMHAATLVAPDRLEVDGSPTADVPPLDTRRAMAGETTIELGAPIVAGDVITVRKRVADLYEKEGRSGPMAFVVMEFVFTNQRDEVVATERFTRIYR